MALIGKMRFSSEYHFKSQLNLIQPHILHDFIVQLDIQLARSCFFPAALFQQLRKCLQPPETLQEYKDFLKTRNTGWICSST